MGRCSHATPSISPRTGVLHRVWKGVWQEGPSPRWSAFQFLEEPRVELLITPRPHPAAHFPFCQDSGNTLLRARGSVRIRARGPASPFRSVDSDRGHAPRCESPSGTVWSGRGAHVYSAECVGTSIDVDARHAVPVVKANVYGFGRCAGRDRGEYPDTSPSAPCTADGLPYGRRGRAHAHPAGSRGTRSSSPSITEHIAALRSWYCRVIVKLALDASYRRRHRRVDAARAVGLGRRFAIQRHSPLMPASTGESNDCRDRRSLARVLVSHLSRRRSRSSRPAWGGGAIAAARTVRSCTATSPLAARGSLSLDTIAAGDAPATARNGRRDALW